MADVAGQQMPAEAPAQDPVPEAPKRRKRKTRAAEAQDPVEPKSLLPQRNLASPQNQKKSKRKSQTPLK